MTSPMHDHLERAIAGLAAQREELSKITDTLQESTATATSKDRTVTVVLNSSGELAELTFHGSRYRKLPAAELSTLILTTIGTARKKAMAKVADAFQPVFGERIPVQDVLSGSFDFEAAMREADKLAESIFPSPSPTPSSADQGK